MFWLLACTSGLDLDKAPRPVGVEDTAPSELPGTIDTGEAPEPPESEYSDGDWIFDDSYVHEIALTLDAEAEKALTKDPYSYATGSVDIDGVAASDVGVRLRGKVGSFRTLDQKPKFKLDFAQFVDGGRLSGLKELALNNEVVDCSYLKEPLAYSVFRSLGVPAGRTSFAHVTVNGDDYGLYVVIEVPDGQFVKAHWDADDGNLYDGKYLYDWKTQNYTMVEFTDSLDGGFQLEEGTDVGRADIHAITKGMDHGGTFAEMLGDLVDETALHPYFVAEQWVGHVDGYALNDNNYRVYFDPADGKAEFVPWDFDYAFIEDYEWGYNWHSPKGRVAGACWNDADCVAAHAAVAEAAATTIDTDSLTTQLTAWQALTQDLAHDDPRRECSWGAVLSEQDDLYAWVDGRDDYLAAFWSN